MEQVDLAKVVEALAKKRGGEKCQERLGSARGQTEECMWLGKDSEQQRQTDSYSGRCMRADDLIVRRERSNKKVIVTHVPEQFDELEHVE